MILPGISFPGIRRTLPDGFDVRETPSSVIVTFGSEDVVYVFTQQVLLWPHVTVERSTPFIVSLAVVEETINMDICRRLLAARELRGIVGGELEGPV